MPFEFDSLKIPGLVKIRPKVFEDTRGYFMETFKQSDFEGHGIGEQFRQDNHSLSKKNVIRGLHYQVPPVEQGKLVTVLKGCAWDVVVDIRRDSPHFLKWVGVELSDRNHVMLYIPPGFAHGFAALSDEVLLVYKCTSEYAPRQDRGIRWNDPDLNIPWPVKTPIVSDKDTQLPLLSKAELF